MRRRCAARSMKAIGGGLTRSFMNVSVETRAEPKRPSASASAAHAAPRRRAMIGCGVAAIETADRDFEACNALITGHRRLSARADCANEGQQLRAQRFRVTDREMPHRVAPVGLEPETFGDLSR